VANYFPLSCIKIATPPSRPVNLSVLGIARRPVNKYLIVRWGRVVGTYRTDTLRAVVVRAVDEVTRCKHLSPEVASTVDGHVIDDPRPATDWTAVTSRDVLEHRQTVEYWTCQPYTSQPTTLSNNKTPPSQFSFYLAQAHKMYFSFDWYTTNTTLFKTNTVLKLYRYKKAVK